MDPSIVKQLDQLNRSFYSRFASEFSGSRSLAQPSLHRLVSFIPPGGSVLDVGCGHGRVAQLMERTIEAAGGDTCVYDYYGLDFSAEFIRQAQVGAAGLKSVSARFAVADLLEPDWDHPLGSRCFDTILALAVFHHIPGYANRQKLLDSLGKRLNPNGKLVVSAWQFTTNDRMKRKIVPWERLGIDPAKLEPNDYLLDWKRGGVGYRYCCLIDGEEMNELASGCGLSILETFRADGKEGDLSLFAIMAHSA